MPNRFFVMSSTPEALIQAVSDFKPDVVLNELTDLPDDAAQISKLADLNARIRTEGTRNSDRGRAAERVAENPGSKRRLAITWMGPMPTL